MQKVLELKCTTLETTLVIRLRYYLAFNQVNSFFTVSIVTVPKKDYRISKFNNSPINTAYLYDNPTYRTMYDNPPVLATAIEILYVRNLSYNKHIFL